MEQIPLWLAAGGLGLALIILMRKPLAAVWRLMFRSGMGMCCLWLFNQVGSFIGIRLGVNLLSGLILGVLGFPGFGMLLLIRWALG